MEKSSKYKVINALIYGIEVTILEFLKKLPDGKTEYAYGYSAYNNEELERKKKVISKYFKEEFN